MNTFFDFFTINLLSSSLRLATPVILAALAAALCNRAGVLNLAIEGEMLWGSFIAIVATYLFRNHTVLGVMHPVLATYLGVFVAMIFGAMMGWFFAWLHTRFRVDLVILSIAINMLASETTVYLMRVLFHQSGTWSDPSIVQLPSYSLPLISRIPMLGKLFSGYNIIVYATWVLAIIMVILFSKTKYGRYLKAVGENPEAARSVGISVKKVQYSALILSGSMACLGGAFLSVGHLTLFTRDMSSGRGWLGNAAALFGFNNPGGSFFAGLFFGIADAVALRLQNVTKIPPYVIQILPYFLTLVILGLVSYKAKLQKSRNSLH
ncbi:ABC transporter permease [uncultured Sphaerochaeta sp.]|uniref:ABC transporter permease n=1 Tax=uncultured Sphaerochaeta sp. TaxID=886478 RepID=UPI002A0A66E4|nr:ABC transporter permease [uncultured Sphaerochaeta sp.]